METTQSSRALEIIQHVPVITEWLKMMMVSWNICASDNKDAGAVIIIWWQSPKRKKVRTFSSLEYHQSVNGYPFWHIINSLGFHSVIGCYIRLHHLLIGNSEVPKVLCQSSIDVGNRAYTLSQSLFFFFFLKLSMHIWISLSVCISLDNFNVREQRSRVLLIISFLPGVMRSCLSSVLFLSYSKSSKWVSNVS